MFIMEDNQWGKIIDHDACQLTSVKHLSSVEKLRKLNRIFNLVMEYLKLSICIIMAFSLMVKE